MIKHHAGAVTMVDNLMDTFGSAQDSTLFAFASDVTSDQSSEIDRMNDMLRGFSPDPRVNLSAGFDDAGQAALNMQLLVALPKPAGFFDPDNPEGLPMDREPAPDAAPDPTIETPDPDADAADDEDGPSIEVAAVDAEAETSADEEEDDDDEQREPRPGLMNFNNSDLAFAGNVLIAGSYHGFNAYDLSDPRAPQHLSSVVCPGGQGDVSVVGDLLIYSVEQTRGRLDCGLEGVAEPESEERFRGIRLFDISDIRAPRQVGAVQTCRGSHTHTVVTDPDDDGNIYVYGSGTGSVRSGEELEGCSADSPFEDPQSALFSIDVIQIPLARPQDARIVSRPRIFSDPDSGGHRGFVGRWRPRGWHPEHAGNPSVPRHYDLPRARPGCRSLFRQRHPSRHQRSGEPGSVGSGGR